MFKFCLPIMGKKKKKKGEQDNEKISVKCVSGNKLLTLLQVGQSKSHKFTSVPSLTVNWNLLPPSMIYGYLCRACENDPVFVAMMIFKCFAGMRRRRRPTHTVYILYMYTHILTSQLRVVQWKATPLRRSLLSILRLLESAELQRLTDIW